MFCTREESILEKDRAAEGKPFVFNWGPGLFIIAYHAILLFGLPLYFFYCDTSSWGLVLFSTALMYVTGLSITVGYHRLYSHAAYKVHPAIEAVIIFFGTMAAQGSAIRWSFDHRHHHAFVDTDRDPYSINKGFWYAHFIWLFEKPKPIESTVVPDLMKNPLLRFQHKHYALLMFTTNLIAVVCTGFVFKDYLGAVVFTFFVRMFFLHHFTWFINSLAHTWGSRHFSQEHSAVDNYIIALLTFGEGYHNYHHTFASDYRNGIRWYHFDPSKWSIWLLHKCGLARQLKRVQRVQIEERLLLDRKRILLEKFPPAFQAQKEEWEKKISDLIDSVLLKLKQHKKVKEEYLQMKKEKKGEKGHLQNLKKEIKDLDEQLAQESKRWDALSGELTSSYS